MKVHFWGVRGSIPTPITPQQIQSKIMAVVQRIQPSDLESVEARGKFIANLPDWIYGTTGGNTACVEIKTSGNELVFDAGSGIRVFGKQGVKPQDKHYNLFMSHFHWDHIQGLPFFDAAYDPSARFDIYSPWDDTEKFFRDQMNQPYYPVPFDAFTKNITFHKIAPGENIIIGDTKIVCCKMHHPGDSYSYAVFENGKKFVYATDVEFKAQDFFYTKEAEIVFRNADGVILDSQYTVEEAYRKENWGHSAFCYAVDFAVHWNIKKLYLFHHEPTYDDKKLNSILQAARWYAQYIEHSEVEIYLAKEDMELDI